MSDLRYLCVVFTQVFIAKLGKMLKLLLLGMLIIAISMALLSIKLIVRKHGVFTSQHIHDSKAMSDLGIHCALEQDKEARLNHKSF